MTVKERKPWRVTPLVESSVLSKEAGCRIFLKLENLQPGGSFKSRGIGNYCLCAFKRAQNPDAVHFFSSSGGNAGIAAVHSANFLGRPSTVVVPTVTKPMMVERIKAAGASEVISHGDSWKDADKFLREVIIPKAEEEGVEPVYVNPFNHPDIWNGHTSLVDELRSQFAELGESPPETVACSVGGGGLFIGIMQGLEKHGWDQTNVLGMETWGAHSMMHSLEAGELQTLPKVTSGAVTLGCARVAERAFELAQKHKATGRFRNAILTDAEAAMGCWRFADDERILVELACGVSLALCYGGRLKRALGRPVDPEEKVVLVVCGGQTVTTSMIEEWKRDFGAVDGALPN